MGDPTVTVRRREGDTRIAGPTSSRFVGPSSPELLEYEIADGNSGSNELSTPSPRWASPLARSARIPTRVWRPSLNVNPASEEKPQAQMRRPPNEPHRTPPPRLKSPAPAPA